MQNKNVDASMNFTETTTGASLTQVTQKTEDINTVYYNSADMSNGERRNKITAAMPENGRLFINQQSVNGGVI